MAPARIVKPIDVLKQRQFTLTPGVPELSPNQFGLQRLEEGFNHSVVITVAFAAHGNLEAVLFQQFIVIM